MEDLFSLEELRQYFPLEEEVTEVLDRMNEVFIKHATYEYEYITYQNVKEKVFFGNPNTQLRIPAEFGKFPFFANNTQVKLQMIPFYMEFVEAVGEYETNLPKLMGFCYVVGKWNAELYEAEDVLPWFQAFLEKGIPKTYEQGYERYQNRFLQMQEIIRLLPQLFDSRECFFMAMKFQKTILHLLGEEYLGTSFVSGDSICYPINHKCIGYWRSMLRRYACGDDLFREWFLEEYRQEYLCLGKQITDSLVLEEYLRAVEERVISKEVLVEKFFHYESQELLVTDMRILTAPNRYPRGKQLYKQYPWIEEVVKQVVTQIIEIELGRGEEPTKYSSVACVIPRIEGSSYFFKLLLALGKESFFRGYEYSTGLTKKGVLSQLLKRCYPAEGDTKEEFLELLKQAKIKEKRLIEAVMYAPQWAEWAEQVLGWKGLVCGVWFFHAHVNETFSTEKETEIAKFSPITLQEFQDGVFDKDWFFKAYQALGEERFQILYQFAKYITSGNQHHRRSQLYCDAVLGKLDAKQIKTEIIEKRNQEKLRCYTLIPIKEHQPKEAIERYEFLQQFLKESKQFGATRRESERKAVDVALKNLAITLGFSDVNHMVWNLESKKIQIR